MPSMRATMPAMTTLTIDQALTQFLDEQQKRRAPRTFRNYEDVIELLRDCLSGYGPQHAAHGRSRPLAASLRRR